MRRPKYYAFLDVVIDVFYSIILYNAFVAFPGFHLSALLMFFSVFVMLNYWWAARSHSILPKFYIVDFYFISGVMFIFSQWPSHFLDINKFLIVTAVFFGFDAIYSLVDIFAHKEKGGEKGLWFYFISESILSLIYLALSLFVNHLIVNALILLYLPYVIWFIIHLQSGLFKTKLEDNGAQPY